MADGAEGVPCPEKKLKFGESPRVLEKLSMRRVGLVPTMSSAADGLAVPMPTKLPDCAISEFPRSPVVSVKTGRYPAVAPEAAMAAATARLAAVCTAAVLM